MPPHETIVGFFERILHYGITVVEVIGAVIVFFYTFMALWNLLRKRIGRCHSLLTDGISTGLSFLLGSEVLKTITAPDWTTVGMTCAILLMRAGMTLLVHFEHKMAKKREEEEQAESAAPKEKN